MSLLDRIDDCTRHDLDFRVPLDVGDETWGQVDSLLVPHLAGFPEVFRCDASRIVLDPALDDYATRTDAVGWVVAALYADGLLDGFRGELYPVKRRWQDAGVFAIERGAVGAFGTPAFGVHMNGYVRTAAGPMLWVGRRAATKDKFPGSLDHLAAGGQPAERGLLENMVKEAEEEAGIPPYVTERAAHVHALCYRRSDEHGFHDDTIHVFDLELPRPFEPISNDGEVEAFELWSPAQVIDRLAAGRDFKDDVALVVIDWLARFGLLEGHPEREPVETRLAALRAC